jgi:anti-sigma-K factor RskA
VKPFSQDLHTLAGVYAVGAVSDVERKRFERHLDGCADCSNEVRGLNETATQLGLIVAQAPPPELKERVMAAAAQTRQNPPLRDHRQPKDAQRPTGWMPRLVSAAAVIAIAVAAALGVIQSRTQSKLNAAQSQLHGAQSQLGRAQSQLGQADSRLTRLEAERRLIESVLGSQGAQLDSKHLKGGGQFIVVFSHATKKAVITTADLPKLSGGHVYQLWLIGTKKNIRSEGLVPTALKSGLTAPVLATGLLPGDVAAMTIEPAGGSAQPTTKPIVTISSVRPAAASPTPSPSAG